MSSPLGTFHATQLVAEREIAARMRSKSFIVSTALMLALIVIGVIAASLFMNRETTTTVAVSATIASELEQVDGLEIVPVGSQEEASALVRDETVDAAVVAAAGSPGGVRITALTDAPEPLVTALTVMPEVELLDPSGGWTVFRYLLSLGFAMAFFAAAMSFGLPVATSVVEEKSTRVVEILITSIPSRALLAGKVLGNTVLAIGQIALVAATLIVALAAAGQAELLTSLGAPIVWFVLFFLTGFVLISTLFAATGALVSRQEDINQAISPVLWIVMLPYMLVIFFNDNPVVMTVMSYIPFSAPIAMPIRVFFDEAAWWEPIVSLLIGAATAVLVVRLSARIYERSLLRMGSRVKWSEALKK